MRSTLVRLDAMPGGIRSYLRWYGAATLVWLLALWPLMIVDVWDESNIFLILQSLPHSLPERLALVWGQYYGLYRPLASSALLLLDRLGFGLIGMRYFNALLLVGAFGVLAIAMMDRWSIDWRRALGFSLVALFSSGALIAATWFANIFDACCLFLIALGISRLTRERFVAAGLLFGLAFYCKEIAILAIPMIPWVMWRSRCLSLGALLRCFVPMVSLAIAYFAIRQHLIPLGTAGDIHQFAASAYWESLLTMAGGFWWQSTRFASGGPMWASGLVMTLAAALLLDGWRDRLLYALLLLLTSFACWGMFWPQGDTLISSFHFVGRLFLIPGTLALFVVVTGHGMRFPWLPWILIVPAVFGAIGTGIDHARFQRMYAQIYAQATASGPDRVFTVNFGDKELNDGSRRLRIGNFPDADLQVSPKDGCLLRKDGSALYCAR